jgi:hypothetical protein
VEQALSRARELISQGVAVACRIITLEDELTEAYRPARTRHTALTLRGVCAGFARGLRGVCLRRMVG